MDDPSVYDLAEQDMPVRAAFSGAPTTTQPAVMPSLPRVPPAISAPPTPVMPSLPRAPALQASVPPRPSERQTVQTQFSGPTPLARPAVMPLPRRPQVPSLPLPQAGARRRPTQVASGVLALSGATCCNPECKHREHVVLSSHTCQNCEMMLYHPPQMGCSAMFGGVCPLKAALPVCPPGVGCKEGQGALQPTALVSFVCY
jgi:hypothetical protein